MKTNTQTPAPAHTPGPNTDPKPDFAQCLANAERCAHAGDSSACWSAIRDAMERTPENYVNATAILDRTFERCQAVLAERKPDTVSGLIWRLFVGVCAALGVVILWLWSQT